MKTDERNWKASLHEIIFESNTRAGKTFDIALLACILLSIMVVLPDNFSSLHNRYGLTFPVFIISP